MIQEAYVSYEVAKLLKEKGFDERTLYHYTNCDVLQHNIVYNKYKNSEMLNAYSAPTHQMACAWLREEKNIHIDIYYLPIHRKYMWSIVETKDPKGAGSKELYEEAVEAALKYTLENLL